MFSYLYYNCLKYKHECFILSAYADNQELSYASVSHEWKYQNMDWSWVLTLYGWLYINYQLDALIIINS